MSEEPGVVSLHVPAQPAYIRLARLVGAGLATELGFDLDELDDVRLAIGEACSLAVQEGAADIRLRYELTDRHLDVVAEAPRRTGARADDEIYKFTDQVLSVACRRHRIGRDGDAVTFSLMFGDEH